jgi:hypothetical protein
LMKDTNDFLDRARADGHITGYDWYISGQGGPHVLILRGEMEQLVALEATPEAQMINMRASLVNEGFQWGYSATGDAIEPMMALWEGLVAQTT